MIFIQLGAGSGDLDPRLNFRDGFTEFVKNSKSNNKEIYLVEANPSNIENLKKCWSSYPNVKIFEIGIVPNNVKDEFLSFYYSDGDKPTFPTFSLDYDFVKKHHPDDKKIKKKEIKVMKISDFLSNFYKKRIDFLAIDLEGVDYQILDDLDFDRYEIENLSFEYIHLSKNEKKNIVKKLNNLGYSYYGFGLDVNNYDYFFKKKKNNFNRFLSKFLHLISNKHLKYLNKFILK